MDKQQEQKKEEQELDEKKERQEATLSEIARTSEQGYRKRSRLEENEKDMEEEEDWNAYQLMDRSFHKFSFLLELPICCRWSDQISSHGRLTTPTLTRKTQKLPFIHSYCHSTNTLVNKHKRWKVLIDITDILSSDFRWETYNTEYEMGQWITTIM